MGRPVGIWWAIMENILGPCPGNIKFLFMIGFWVKYACFLFAMHIVGPACIAQIYPCLLLFFSSPRLSWGRWSLAGGVCWNTFSKALSSSPILCVSSAMFLQFAFAAVSPEHLSSTAWETGWWIAIWSSCWISWASFLDERHSEIADYLHHSALPADWFGICFQRPHSTIPPFAGRPTERLCWTWEPNFNCSGSPPEEGLFMLKETSLKFQRIFKWTCKSIWKTTETGIDTVLYTSWVQLFSDRHLCDCLLVSLST